MPVLGAAWLLFGTSFVAIATTQAPQIGHLYPVHFTVWSEEGLDQNLVEAIVRVAIRQYSLLLGQPAMTYEIRRFADDGVHNYSAWGPDTYGPSSPYIVDRLVDGQAFDPMLKGRLEFSLAFLNGSGDGFAGLSNYGRYLAVYLTGIRGFFLPLGIAIHEIGHAFGLPHNPDSPIMQPVVGGIWRALPRPENLTDPDLETRFEVGMLPSFRGVALLWGYARPGVIVDRIDNSTYTTQETLMQVFWDSESNEVHQIAKVTTTVVSGNRVVDLTEQFFVLSVPSGWHLRLWSPDELWYLTSWTRLAPSYLAEHALDTFSLALVLQMLFRAMADPIVWLTVAATWRMFYAHGTRMWAARQNRYADQVLCNESEISAARKRCRRSSLLRRRQVPR